MEILSLVSGAVEPSKSYEGGLGAWAWATLLGSGEAHSLGMAAGAIPTRLEAVLKVTQRRSLCAPALRRFPVGVVLVAVTVVAVAAQAESAVAVVVAVAVAEVAGRTQSELIRATGVCARSTTRRC